MPALATPSDTLVKAPGGPTVRPDPCFQGGTGTGVGRIVSGPDYRVGPGDVVEVQFVGRLDVTRQQLVVDPEGVISIPPIGTVKIGGLSLREANRRVADHARQLFRFGEISLAVVTARCFEIVLSGEVDRPGAIQASAVRRVHEIILAVGGITPRGSLRRVEVTRGKSTVEIDLLRFEMRGDLSQNPFVEEGMAVHVPPRGPFITLAGAVRRPGDYEIGPRASLRDLLDVTGGLSQSAAPTEARLTRLLPDGRKETITADLTKALARPADVPLAAGDQLFVPSLTLLQEP